MIYKWIFIKDRLGVYPIFQHEEKYLFSIPFISFMYYKDKI